MCLNRQQKLQTQCVHLPAVWSLFIHSCYILDRWWISQPSRSILVLTGSHFYTVIAQALPEFPAVVFYGIANTQLGVTQAFALCGPQSFSTSTFPYLVYRRNWGICFCADCRSDHNKHFALFIVRLLHEYVTVTSPTKTNTNQPSLFSNFLSCFCPDFTAQRSSDKNPQTHIKMLAALSALLTYKMTPQLKVHSEPGKPCICTTL